MTEDTAAQLQESRQRIEDYEQRRDQFSNPDQLIVAEIGKLAQTDPENATLVAKEITDEFVRVKALVELGGALGESELFLDALAIVQNSQGDRRKRASKLGFLANRALSLDREPALGIIRSIESPMTRAKGLLNIAQPKDEEDLLREVYETVEEATEAGIAFDERFYKKFISKCSGSDYRMGWMIQEKLLQGRTHRDREAYVPGLIDLNRHRYIVTCLMDAMERGEAGHKKLEAVADIIGKTLAWCEEEGFDPYNLDRLKIAKNVIEGRIDQDEHMYPRRSRVDPLEYSD